MRTRGIALCLALMAVSFVPIFAAEAPSNPAPCAATEEAPCPADMVPVAETASVARLEPEWQPVVPAETFFWLADDTEPLMSTEEAVCSEPTQAGRGPKLLCYDNWGCNTFCCAKRGVIKKVRKCCSAGRDDCQALCQALGGG